MYTLSGGQKMHPKLTKLKADNKCHSSLSTIDPELHQLVQTLQTHKHSPTVTCRFNYPRPSSATTRLIATTDPGLAAQFYVYKHAEEDK